MIVLAGLAGTAAPLHDENELPLTLVRVIASDRAGSHAPFEAFDTASFALFDVDGDGVPEIVANNDNNRAYVIDPRRGVVLAELSMPLPPGWRARELAGVTVGDLTGNGRTNVAIHNSASYLTLFEFDPWQSHAFRFRLEPLWTVSTHGPDLDPEYARKAAWLPSAMERGSDGHAYAADVAGTGEVWFFAQNDDQPAHFAIDASGSLRWMTHWFDGNSGPWVGDLDGDGTLEAVFTTDGGQVAVYDARSGRVRWVLETKALGAHPGSIPIGAFVQDLDGDGRREIFVGARVAVEDPNDPDWMRRQHALYALVRADGTVLWARQYPFGHPLWNNRPVAYDVDGDGVLDVVTLDWNTIGHKPGRWQALGPANLWAASGRDGSVLWHTRVDARWSNKNFVVADFLPEEPGLEILVSRQRHVDGLGLYALADGSERGFVPLPAGGWESMRGPVLADVDNDGLLDALVPIARRAEACSRQLDVGCREGAFAVYRTHADAGTSLFTNNQRNFAPYDERTPPPPVPSRIDPQPQPTSNPPAREPPQPDPPRQDPPPTKETETIRESEPEARDPPPSARTDSLPPLASPDAGREPDPALSPRAREDTAVHQTPAAPGLAALAVVGAAATVARWRKR